MARVSPGRVAEIKAAVDFKRKINAERFVLDGVVALHTKDVDDLIEDLEEAREDRRVLREALRPFIKHQVTFGDFKRAKEALGATEDGNDT